MAESRPPLIDAVPSRTWGWEDRWSVPPFQAISVPSEQPLVSILLFCRNGAATVRRSIESVLTQSYPKVEYIVQDGASTDGTLEILQSYGSQIDVVSERDGGTNDGFSRALQRARGEIIGTCLADEALYPDAVESAVAAFAADPDAGALMGDAHFWDLEGDVFGKHVGGEFDLFGYLFGDYCPNFAACFFRKRALEQVGFFADRWKRGEVQSVEFEIWCRLGSEHRVTYLPQTLSRYGMHPGQQSNNLRRIVDELTARTMILREFLFGRERFLDEYPVLLLFVLKRQYEIVINHLRCNGRIAEAGVVEGLMKQAVDLEQHEIMSRDPAWLRAGLYEVAARIYRDRAQLDQAWAMWKRARPLGDVYVDSMACQGMLKSQKSTDASLLEVQREWASRHARPLASQAEPRFAPRPAGERIAVGYHCGFWQMSTARAQILPFVAAHDRDRFRVVGYSPAAVGCEVAAHFDDFRVVDGVNDANFVDLVRADGIDVFVELTGLSFFHRYPAMASRCAPVQISYLNHTGTCAVPNVDYVLADAIAAPAEGDAHYTEEIWRLPRCFFCFVCDEAALPPPSAPPVLANGHVTFGCFGSADKLADATIELWAGTLRAVPESRLLLQNGGLTSRSNREYLAKRFAWAGIPSERLILLPGGSRATVLANYARVDVSLDTFPYCGGNTIAESVYQGVPVVSLQGDRFSSAYGASLLRACGLAECVAHTPDEFAAVAARLAADRARLRFLRQNLRSMAHEHGLSDVVGFTRSLEDAYTEMLRRRFA
jgi:predicted O-linked N-acetylglucosamine transferase (SPINDLY family)